MARYEESRERRGRGDSRGSNYSRRDNERGGRSFGGGDRSFGGNRGGSRGGFSGRDNSRDRRDVEMTKVICSTCGEECEVPFKPTSSKPVYCDKCFSKKGKSNSSQPSNRDLDVINEKLNKIMKALKIE